ncbi:DUF3618 domain-containing protein [Agromyces soli]
MTAATDGAAGARPASKRDQKTRERNLTRVEARAASEKARAEFAATLDALEDKLNVPKQVGIRVDRLKVKAKAFYDEQPVAAVAAAAGIAAAVGGLVWLIVRSKLGD